MVRTRPNRRLDPLGYRQLVRREAVRLRRGRLRRGALPLRARTVCHRTGRRGRTGCVPDQQGDQLPAADRLAGRWVLRDNTAVRVGIGRIVRLDRRPQLERSELAYRNLGGQPAQVLQAGLATGGDARRKGHCS
jgi:hypothetical protein